MPASTVPLSVPLGLLTSMYFLVQEDNGNAHKRLRVINIAIRESAVFFIKDLCFVINLVVFANPKKIITTNIRKVNQNRATKRRVIRGGAMAFAAFWSLCDMP